MSKYYLSYVFFFKQKTAYEVRISDWSSDVCSSDLGWTGYLGRTLGKGSEWTDIFGPIRVAVRPGKSSGYDTSRRAPALGGHLYRPTDGSKEVRVHIGSVEVTALERITVAMLRSYSKSGVQEIGRETGRERVGQEGWIWGGAGEVKKKRQ